MLNKLIVVTVNYCCAEAIFTGLDETVAQLRAMGDARFWIVDNCSPDGSGAVLQQAVAERGYDDVVEIIAAPENGGFGAGNNVAIRRAQDETEPPDYIYLLNPDAVPQPGAIAALRAFLDAHPEAGAVGSALQDEDGTLQAAFYRFPSFASEIERAVQFGPLRSLLIDHVLPMPPPSEPRQVDWITGASMMLRRTALDAVGGFDETFFLYWEEVELCHRLAQGGYEVWALPEVVVSHIGGVTTGIDDDTRRVPGYWFASRNHLFRKTGLAGNLLWLNLAVTVGLAVRRVHQGLRGRPMTPPHHLRDFVASGLGRGRE